MGIYTECWIQEAKLEAVERLKSKITENIKDEQIAQKRYSDLFEIARGVDIRSFTNDFDYIRSQEEHHEKMNRDMLRRIDTEIPEYKRKIKQIKEKEAKERYKRKDLYGQN